jgi:hypothetical protein
LAGTELSSTGVRGVWLRHGIGTRYKRLMRFEQHVQGDTIVLSDTQIRLLERHSVQFRCRHVEASWPGELQNQKTFYWGTLKGVGEVYVKVVVDVFCSLVFAKVYTATLPATAADLLYDRVLPFYEALGVVVGAILTDVGHEFCGVQQGHPYVLFVGDGRYRTPNDQDPQPAHQRPRRAHESNTAR